MSLLGERRGQVGRDLEKVLIRGTTSGVSDGQLLRRFVDGRDEPAFEALLTRHGPMVLGVCRRILGVHPDADDAFQATFLVLVRRAGSFRDADSLGPWLYGVARRVALRARGRRARRRHAERNAASARPVRTEAENRADRLEIGAILDEELDRLPAKYRRPIVLCYLEGLTQEAAARRLRWTAGVLRGRLDRARLRLRKRLALRGVMPAAGLALTEWLGAHARAAVPPALSDATALAAGRILTSGKVSGGFAATTAMSLTGEILRRQYLGWAVLLAALVAGGSLTLACVARIWALGGTADPVSSAHGPAPAAPSENAFAPPAAGTIHFRVVERTSGRPLPGVQLTAVIGDARTLHTTDATGEILLNNPSPRPDRIRVDAWKDGFMPMAVWLEHPNHDEEYPATFALEMIPAVPIGGLVVDDGGRPVVGARLWPIFDMIARENDRVEIRAGESTRTDSAGRWTFPCTRPGYDQARLIRIRISHPEFETAEISRDELERAVGPSGRIVLHRGITLEGRVVDAQGRPVGGALLRAIHGGEPLVKTDEQGRFHLGYLTPRETVICVGARGHGPELIRLDPMEGLPPVEVKLGRSRTIRGRVVDRAGRPIPGVLVSADYWRELNTLDWSAVTGADGRFVWDEAPSETVWLYPSGNGYIGGQYCVVAASESEPILTVARALRVSGTVVDARTREPIESFTVTPGVETPDGSITSWDRSRSRRMKGGRFEIRFRDRARDGHILRIEARGYTQALSRPIADAEEDARLEFELVPDAAVLK